MIARGLLCVICLFLLPRSPAITRAEAAPPPNIIFILTDDQRYDALGCADKEWVRTPCLDSLALRSAPQ